MRYMTERKHRQNSPALQWLLATVFLFPILPEYLSPFLLFVSFIIFKIQWSREGRKAKVGTIGKVCIAFMSFALLSVFWSDTKLDTLGTAGLWWAVFLILVMIYNLADTPDKIDSVVQSAVYGAAANGFVGAIQICTYALNRAGYISKSFVLPTPFYRDLDKAVYTWLPFKIETNTFSNRASGFFSNPNLLASYLLFAFPFSVYLFLNAKTKKQKFTYFIANLLISAGISATMTRAACLIVLAGWLVMFIVVIKRHWGGMLQLLIPTVLMVIPSLLTRYGIISVPIKTPPIDSIPHETAAAAAEAAKRSSSNHFIIWESVFDYITDNIRVFFAGLGFGCESTGNFLLENYDLDKPHAHNFVLEIWAELGIIGFVILAAILVMTVVTLFKVKTGSPVKYHLVFYTFVSLAMFTGFGLTDYIFNSPKQIILLMIIIGITQSLSRCYEESDIRVGVRSIRPEMSDSSEGALT